MRSGKDISINTITSQYRGLDAQLFYWSTQTHKNFEIVIIDDLWTYRHKYIEKLIKKLNLDVVYRKPMLKPKNIVFATHSAARNEALIYSDAKYVLFFDDWQIPDMALLEEHLKYLDDNTAVCGSRIGLNYTDIWRPNFNDLQDTDHRNRGGDVRDATWADAWTCNLSVPLKRLIDINGCDYRFNGADGGEDIFGIGLHLAKTGIKFLYNQNAQMYHVDHRSVKGKTITTNRPKDDFHFVRGYWYNGHQHDISPFISGDKHGGDQKLMYNQQFNCWLDEWGIKHYKCKICGVEGVCGSTDVINAIKSELNYNSPKVLFNLSEERGKFRDNVVEKYVV